MRTALAATFALLGSVVFALATPASAAPADPPAATEQHVTVPSLPGQPNKDAVVRPSGSLKTDGNGWVVTKPNASGTPSTPPASSRQTAPARDGNNTVTIRGVVEAVSSSRSVTIRRTSSSSDVTYRLAPGAAVPTGLKPGERVKLRVLVLEKHRVADRVERLKEP